MHFAFFFLWGDNLSLHCKPDSYFDGHRSNWPEKKTGALVVTQTRQCPRVSRPLSLLTLPKRQILDFSKLKEIPAKTCTAET